MWGPGALLRDLELRLALTNTSAPHVARVARHAAHIAAAADTKAFYAASFATDPLGTADVLLTWRDTLIEAGWTGEELGDGGPRLAALARLEQGTEAVPPGEADRIVAVLATLSREPSLVYDELTLAEPLALWPGSWRRIFEALASQGTTLATLDVARPGAPRDTDLGALQELLRCDVTHLSRELRGDGSLLVVRGETPTELAALTASLLARDSRRAVVVRSGDAAPLEAALAAHGLAVQGLATSSPWRPAMQILPLAVELAFEPRDPRRALELLTLTVGPFRGSLGRRLAKAISRSPGIGGREWQTRKLDARDVLHARELARGIENGASTEEATRGADAFVTERMERIAEWLEAPGVDPRGAPPATFAAIAERVRTFLREHLATAPDVYAPALTQAKQLADLLSHETRARLSREEVRQLVETVVRAPHDHARTVEAAGRVPHVPHPSALLHSCDTLCFWGFTAEAERRPKPLVWNGAERRALASADVRLQDPSEALLHENDLWRRAVLSAEKRVLFIVPASANNVATAPHALWDEIGARLDLDGPATSRLTRHARQLLDEPGDLVEVAARAPLPLPDAPPTWKSALDVVGDVDVATSASVTSLETLVGCPLRWVLEERADLSSGAVAKLASDSLLCGNLGHRLVEELFDAGAFDRDEHAYATEAATILTRLVRSEAATLLMPGMAFERAQLVPQLLRAVRELRRYLERTGFRIQAVEEETEVASPAGRLRGRVDIRLADGDGLPAILDLKWGESRYRGLVKEGRAVQLAAYGRALSPRATGPFPPAGYFAIRSGVVVTADERLKPISSIDGPSLEATWRLVERTAAAVVASLRAGDVPVSAVRRSLPLLDALGIPPHHHADHYAPTPIAACTYCSYGPLCGRDWDSLR